jgi:hypothetical protein
LLPNPQSEFPNPRFSRVGAYRIPVESTVEKIATARSLGADGIILFSYDSTTRPTPLNPVGDYLERVSRSAFDGRGPE